MKIENKMLKKIYLLLILVVFLVGCNQTTTTKIIFPDGDLSKEDIISNLENAKYIKVETFIKLNFNQETKETSSLVELDYVNDKTHMDYSYNLDGKENKQEYYRDGNIFYINVDGNWKTQPTKNSKNIGESMDIIKRLESTELMNYVMTEKIDSVETYLFKSEIDEKEALEFIKRLFEDAITGSSGDFVIKEAETKWWVNKETKELVKDLRTVNFEIDGIPMGVVFENKFFDYNKVIDIKLPEGLN